MPPKNIKPNFTLSKNTIDQAKKLSGIEDDTILLAAKAYIEADVTIPPNTLTYHLEKRQGDFAYVGVATNPGGFYAMLKKSQGIWVVIATGQDKPMKDVGEKYGLPKDWYYSN